MSRSWSWAGSALPHLLFMTARGGQSECCSQSPIPGPLEESRGGLAAQYMGTRALCPLQSAQLA